MKLRSSTPRVVTPRIFKMLTRSKSAQCNFAISVERLRKNIRKKASIKKSRQPKTAPKFGKTVTKKSGIICKQCSKVTPRMAIPSLPAVLRFSKRDPANWFRKLEDTFTISEIVDDDIKYAHLQAVLEPAILGDVADFFESPPTKNKYEGLKAKLITRYIAESRDDQILRLLEDVTLGDRFPSELLNELRWYGEDQISEDVVRDIFIEKLPEKVAGILAASSEPLSSIGTLADCIYKYTYFPSLASVSGLSNSALLNIDPNILQLINTLVENLTKLTTRIADLEGQVRSWHFSQYRQRLP